MPGYAHGRRRVAVYLDFDNVVISRYDQRPRRAARGVGTTPRQPRRHGRLDRPDRREARGRPPSTSARSSTTPPSFGTVALTRAYADWSVPANAAYRAPARRPRRRPRAALPRVRHEERRRHPAGRRRGRGPLPARRHHPRPDRRRRLRLRAARPALQADGPLRRRRRRRRLDQHRPGRRLRRVHRLRTAPRASAARQAATATADAAPAKKAAAPKAAAEEDLPRRKAAKTPTKAPRTEPPEQAAATSLLLRADAGGRPEERRRAGCTWAGSKSTDAAHGPRLQGEVAGLLVVPARSCESRTDDAARARQLEQPARRQAHLTTSAEQLTPGRGSRARAAAPARLRRAARRGSRAGGGRRPRRGAATG